MRPRGDLWSAAVIARDPDTGMAKWAYQFTPHDTWDFDGVNEAIVADLRVGGPARTGLVHFGRNGFACMLDAATGKVLVAGPFVAENWARKIDLSTGVKAG